LRKSWCASSTQTLPVAARAGLISAKTSPSYRRMSQSAALWGNGLPIQSVVYFAAAGNLMGWEVAGCSGCGGADTTVISLALFWHQDPPA
jgi:hypothetical protein